MVDFSWASIGFHRLDCECQSNLSTGGAWPHACGAQARGRRPRGAQLPPAVACRLQPVAWRRLQQASRGQRTCLVHVGRVGARGPGGCSQAQMPNQEAGRKLLMVHVPKLQACWPAAWAREPSTASVRPISRPTLSFPFGNYSDTIPFKDSRPIHPSPHI